MQFTGAIHRSIFNELQHVCYYYSAPTHVYFMDTCRVVPFPQICEDTFLGNLMLLCLFLFPSNVTVMEMIVTVFLAVLVCVVACLLLNTGFYRDFWSFWFCFVVATAHFSLIKVSFQLSKISTCTLSVTTLSTGFT